MKRNMLCAAMILAAGSMLAADKDDVSAAIAKLAAADNYSWTTTTTNVPPPGGGGGGRGRGRGGFGGPTEGKTQKDGLIYLSMPGRGGTPTVGYVMNTNVAIQTENGWQSYAEATADDGGGGFNPGMFTAIRLQTTKSPADEAKTLLESAKSVTKTDDGYTAVLTDDAAKARLQFNGFGRGRGGGGGGGFQVTITDAKGAVKFWVKDGVLSKYELKSTGNSAFGDNDPMPVDRTTTVEIKDIGGTKLDLPAEAKKKLS